MIDEYVQVSPVCQGKGRGRELGGRGGGGGGGRGRGGGGGERKYEWKGNSVQSMIRGECAVR